DTFSFQACFTFRTSLSLCAIKSDRTFFCVIARRQSLMILLFGLLIRLSTAAPLIPEYKLGDTAATEVVSPIHLIVIDHERTEKLRREEAQRSAAIFRFYPGLVDEAEASLRSAWSAAREKFLENLEANY